MQLVIYGISKLYPFSAMISESDDVQTLSNMPQPLEILPWASYMWNCGLRMRRECRKRLSRHRLQRKLPVSDPGMHHGTCVAQVPWCMSGSLTHGCGENVPGIHSACATRNFTYLLRGPLMNLQRSSFGRWQSTNNTEIHVWVSYQM